MVSLSCATCDGFLHFMFELLAIAAVFCEESLSEDLIMIVPNSKVDLLGVSMSKVAFLRDLSLDRVVRVVFLVLELYVVEIVVRFVADVVGCCLVSDFSDASGKHSEYLFSN